MMQVVEKYDLGTKSVQIIRLPLKRVLSVQMQDRKPCLWALVDPEAPNVLLTIRIAGTGTQDDYDYATLRYIGTTWCRGQAQHWFYERPCKGNGVCHAGT